MSEKKLSDLRKLLLDGAIANFYTQDGYFIKVRPCLSIDKVKFSFVEKGSEGKNALDIYVGTEDFDNFCDEILSGVMYKKVQEDKGDFPNAWVYVTGTNGSKELHFGSGSMQPLVFQGRDKINKFNAFVGVGNWDDVRNMAKMWRRISKPYWEELTETLYEAMAKIDEYHTNDVIEEKTDYSPDTNAFAVPSVESTPVEAPASDKPAKDDRLAIVTGNAEHYTLMPVGPLEQAENYTDAKPSYTLKCSCKELGKDVEVVFLSAPINKSVSNFNLLKVNIDKGWRGSFRIEGQMSEYKGRQQLRFTTFAKGA